MSACLSIAHSTNKIAKVKNSPQKKRNLQKHLQWAIARATLCQAGNWEPKWPPRGSWWGSWRLTRSPRRKSMLLSKRCFLSRWEQYFCEYLTLLDLCYKILLSKFDNYSAKLKYMGAPNMTSSALIMDKKEIFYQTYKHFFPLKYIYILISDK